MQTARTLVSLFEHGLDNRADVAGWHGTSLEAIELTLLRGTLPGSALDHGEAGRGHLFFFPARENDFEPVRARPARNYGRPGAMNYAESSAEIAYMVREFGLDPARRDHHRSIFDALDHLVGYSPEGEAALKQLQAWGISLERLQAEAAIARERKGVLIAISHKALLQFDATDGDVPGWDMKLHIPSGLPLEYMSGIEPLGEREFAYFETLQNLVAEHT